MTLMWSWFGVVAVLYIVVLPGVLYYWLSKIDAIDDACAAREEHESAE